MKSENIILFIAAFAAISALLSAGFIYYSAASLRKELLQDLPRRQTLLLILLSAHF